VLLTGEKKGYYRAFADKPLDHLARSLTENFAYQGEVFPLHNRSRGAKSAHLPPDATIPAGAVYRAQIHGALPRSEQLRVFGVCHNVGKVEERRGADPSLVIGPTG
jgi:hypothetical protein